MPSDLGNSRPRLYFLFSGGNQRPVEIALVFERTVDGDGEVHVHMCCRHTAADAYCLGYDIVVPRQTTDSFTEEDFNSGIKYLEEVYGAKICDLDDFIARI